MAIESGRGWGRVRPDCNEIALRASHEQLNNSDIEAGRTVSLAERLWRQVLKIIF